ncbi:MAG: TIGR01777 family protein [Acidobacteria bacterium]|nr:TIGR01777 family protein [Acidobacteriota bacterium]
MGLEKGSTVLVTGATGFIGRALTTALHERGYELAILSRRVDRVRAQPHIKLVQAWNPQQEPAPVSVIERAQAIVHLAGESIAGRWTEAKKRAIRNSRVEGTRNLVVAIAQAKTRPRVLVSASAVGYYGDRGEETLTEESGPGSDFLALVCQAWETEARRAEAHDVRVVCLRSGIVLDRDGGALQQMLPPFRLGLGGPLGNGRQWMPWIHRDDTVGLILHALENEKVSGPVNGTAPEPVRNIEFTKTLGRVLNRPTFLAAPEFVLKLLLGEFADVLLASPRVLPARAQAAGYAFKYSTLEPALRACLQR